MNTRKNTLYNVAYRVFSMLLPLVTAPYLSRVVGTEGVGLYGYSWAVSYVFVLIGLLGLENYGPREIARVRDDRDALNRTFSAIWKMQRLVAGVTLLVWLVYVFFIAGEEKIISLNLTMMSVSCLVNLDWCLMGLDEFKPIALRNTAVKLLAAAAVFLFVRKPEDLWVYAFVWSLSTLLGCLSCMFSLRGKVTPVKVTWKEALKHLAPCALLSISVIAVSVYRQMDKVMIGALADMAQTGLYEMTRMKQMDAVKRHIRLSMELVMCMVCAMAFGLAAVAVNFAPLFYGDDFAYSGTLMIPLSFTLLSIGFANVIRTQWVLPQGRDTIFVHSVLTGAVINLIANFVLIPPFGAMGAAAATVLAEFSVPAVQFVYLRKELPYAQYLKTTGVYCLFGLVMAGVVALLGYVLPLHGWGKLAVQVTGGAAVYGALCLTYWKLAKRSDIFRLMRRK